MGQDKWVRCGITYLYGTYKSPEDAQNIANDLNDINGILDSQVLDNNPEFTHEEVE